MNFSPKDNVLIHSVINGKEGTVESQNLIVPSRYTLIKHPNHTLFLD